MTFEIDISCGADPVDIEQIRKAVIHGLTVEQVASAVLSISLVDDATIHRLNRDHLQHDYPTDVISFQLDWSGPNSAAPADGATGRSRAAAIEGEIIASVEYAKRMAADCGWDTQCELTLYVIHGMLHICGYDDLTPAEKEIMRSREKAVLSGLGLRPSYPGEGREDDEPPGSASGPSAADSSEGLR